MVTTYHRYIRLGWVGLLLVVLGVPVVSWVLHTTFSDAVGSTFFTLKLLGQITGIIGAQLFAFGLILSARIAFIEKLFGGLDKLYVIHHRIGVIAFSFLAVHPLILAFRYADESFKEVADFLSPIGNTMPITFGICAILLMLILLCITLYGAIFKYPALKVAHKFLGGAFFLGFIHILFIPSSLNNDSVLRGALLITGAFGLVAFTYRSLLGKWLVPRYVYTVTGVTALPGSVTEIFLTTIRGKKLFHTPGQFGMLSFINSTVVAPEEHPFTISSPGDDGTIRFSIKGLGDYTKLLSALTVGTQAHIEGPFGEFSYIYGGEKQVWVAGGIGVTPFVSMAEHMLSFKVLPYVIDFYYSVRTEADATYKELFERVSAKHASFRFHLMPSDTKGYISAQLLVTEINDIGSRDIFICGPPPMMIGLIDQLIAVNISKKFIHSERFALLK